MVKITHKIYNQILRHRRVRSTIIGTAEKPRLSVFISNHNITAQLVNDTERQTIVYVSTIGVKEAKGTMTEKATWVGTEIAKKAKVAKIQLVVFDRGSRLYHGRIKALAEAARQEGLVF
jgi:large subunit ribosomal protein L18